MEFPKRQDRFSKSSRCLPKHAFKNSFIFNRIESHDTTFKLFKRVYSRKPKPLIPSLVHKHPVPFPGDNWCYPKHTVSEISLKTIQYSAGHIIFMGWMETSYVLMSWKWVVWGLELNFWGILQRLPKFCITNTSDGNVECVWGQVY